MAQAQESPAPRQGGGFSRWRLQWHRLRGQIETVSEAGSHPDPRTDEHLGAGLWQARRPMLLLRRQRAGITRQQNRHPLKPEGRYASASPFLIHDFADR